MTGLQVSELARGRISSRSSLAGAAIKKAPQYFTALMWIPSLLSDAFNLRLLRLCILLTGHRPGASPSIRRLPTSLPLVAGN